MATKEETIAVLRRFDLADGLLRAPVLPKAAVLIPLFVKDGALHTLLTLRAKQLRTSGGEVCFPGGKRDPRDKDDVETALREAEEEIGLPANQVQVVCRLFPLVSKNGLLVTPVVGFIDETFCPRPNLAEVSAVFPVPLDFFTREKDHRAPPPASWMHSFHFVDPGSGTHFHIWGLTAMMGIMAAAFACRKEPEFDVGFDIGDPLPFFQQNLQRQTSKL